MHLRLNRLELEHAYLAEQNAHLVKELSFARCTINALRNITHQKETNLDAARQELERAYFRIRMLSMTLARQEQRLREQQAAMETRIPSPSPSSSSSSPAAVAADPVAVLQSSPHYHYGQLQTTLCNQLGPQQQQQHGYNGYQEEQQQQPMDHYGKQGGQQLTPPESPRSVDEGEGSQEEYMCDIVSQPPVNVMMLPGNFE